MAIDASTATLRPVKESRSTSFMQFGASSERSLVNPVIPMMEACKCFTTEARRCTAVGGPQQGLDIRAFLVPLLLRQQELRFSQYFREHAGKGEGGHSLQER